MNLRLKLRKNQSTIPIEKLTSDLHGVEILGDSVEKLPSLAHLVQCRYLYLFCPQLSEFPALPPHLEILKVRGGHFAIKDEDLTSLSKLKSLSLTQNGNFEKISQLPLSLEILDLSHNKLKDLPTGLFKLKSLSRLTLDSNLLIDLPSELYEMSSLNHLSLDGNPLSEDTKNSLHQSFGLWF